jgi:hypothetical protein
MLPRRCASARAHASRGVLRPLRDLGCGSPLWLPRPIARPGPSRAPPRSTLRSVLRLSQPLDGLTPPTASRPCFMPLPRAGFASLQGFPLPGSFAGFVTQLLPSCRYRLAPWARRGRNLCTPGDETVRLQGFAPPESPFPETGCYSCLRADPLMGFLFPLPGFPAPCRGRLPKEVTLRSCPWSSRLAQQFRFASDPKVFGSPAASFRPEGPRLASLPRSP